MGTGLIYSSHQLQVTTSQDRTVTTSPVTKAPDRINRATAYLFTTLRHYLVNNQREIRPYLSAKVKGREDVGRDGRKDVGRKDDRSFYSLGRGT